MKSRRSPVAAVFCLVALNATPSAWAHRRFVGFGFESQESGSSNAFALTMAFFIGAMIVALLATLFYFRWRAAHPLPGPESIHSVIGHSTAGQKKIDPPQASQRNAEEWERPANWWRDEDEANPDS